MTYLQFKTKWTGGKTNPDNYAYFQCVDLILQYLRDCFGVFSGVWGNAIDYWNYPATSTPQKVLATKFTKTKTTDCKQGDIVVLYGLTGNPYGHIGIADSQTASTVTILEQNGVGGGNGLGNNAIRLRAVSKTRVAGIWRPKTATAPTPTTPAPARATVFLPSSAGTWAAYRVGSGLRKGTSDQIGTLLPKNYPPGLPYKIEARVGDYAVIIQTQSFGRVTIWIKGTSAVIK